MHTEVALLCDACRYLEAGPGQGRQAGQGEQDSGCEQSDFSDLQSSSDVSDQVGGGGQGAAWCYAATSLLMLAVVRL